VYTDDLKVEGNFSRSPERYYLEWMARKVGLNADIDAAYTTEVARAISTGFELLGTNAVTTCSTYSATDAAMLLTTTAADNDQVILLPHLDSEYSPWTGVKWGTENQVIWEAQIMTTAVITPVLIWAGLKLTNTPVIATDADQVFFRFSTDDTDAGWVCESSIGGTDTATASGVTVAINTTYNFRIEIDSDRKASFYINDVFIYRTTALTNDINLIPYIGLQQLGSGDSSLTLVNEKISRIIFE
jgi:hypothetical protein